MSKSRKQNDCLSPQTCQASLSVFVVLTSIVDYVITVASFISHLRHRLKDQKKVIKYLSKQGLRNEILTTVSISDDIIEIVNMITIFNIVKNSMIHDRLLTELNWFVVSRHHQLSLREERYWSSSLEQSAVIKEDLRYASSVVSRTSRLTPSDEVILRTFNFDR